MRIKLIPNKIKKIFKIHEMTKLRKIGYKYISKMNKIQMIELHDKNRLWILIQEV
uniref:Cytochrome b6-f complex subunit PetP n=1 Tax=Tolypiocladia glomerulata TaxID=860646 RepID=A0A1Z1MV51_9FLOR|nr:cytochrome b6-f complex subunit PetP [Tolypiocladia glomerulata]ARW69769.1 cytochrome b6-f complex subunit PetP [Tolypiocladia glomerulata]